MEATEIKAIIKQELPKLLEEPAMRDFVLRTVSQFYAGKQETESKFDRILAELQRDREEQAKKWEENNKKWDEFNKKWEEYLKKSEENDKKWYEQHEINKKLFLNSKTFE